MKDTDCLLCNAELSPGEKHTCDALVIQALADRDVLAEALVWVLDKHLKEPNAILSVTQRARDVLNKVERERLARRRLAP